MFTWNDAGLDGAYWIKFENIEFGYQTFTAGNAAGEASINAPVGGGAIFKNCTFYANNALNAGATGGRILAVQGTVELNLCRFSKFYSGWVLKTGADAIINVIDCVIDDTLGNGSGVCAVFRNAATGGSLSLDRVTFTQAHSQDITLVQTTKDWALTVNRLDWNSTDGIYAELAIPIDTGYVTEPWVSGITIRDSIFRPGNFNFSCIGCVGVANNGQNFSNFIMDHCEIVSAAGRPTGGNAKLLELGDGNAAGQSIDGLQITWCYFSAQTPAHLAGNEVMDIFRVGNAEIAYCWTEQCGEDAFEIELPYDNCHIHHCGGGALGGPYVSGNMVDIYGGGGAWANSTNCSIHHIWGYCGSDAVVSEGCRNIAIHDIYTVNVLGGFVQNPPVAGVRIHSYGAGDLIGTSIAGALPPVADSFGGRPTVLTFQPECVTTVSGTENPGQTVITVVNASQGGGIAIGDVISILRNNGLIHRSTVTNRAGNDVTIADALPSAATNTAVEAATPWNSSATWLKWNGSAFVAGSDSDGLADTP